MALSGHRSPPLRRCLAAFGDLSADVLLPATTATALGLAALVIGALDLETEAHLDGLVCAGPTTVISVGHRPSVADIRLTAEGVSGPVPCQEPPKVGVASIDPRMSHWQALRQRLGDVLQHWAERLRSSDPDADAVRLPDAVVSATDPAAADASGDAPTLPLEALTLDPSLMGLEQELSGAGPTPAALAALCPGLREPLSVEDAVLARQMKLLKREAADALAALGAAHALVSSARLAQVQQLRPRVEAGEVPGEELMALAADYQGWQNDQVRLFDALALVLRMRVPQGMALDQVDPDLQRQARAHLQSLSVEYQRQLLQAQFQRLS